MTRLKIGVIGTGVMGSYHLKNYAEIAKEPNSPIELVGIFDTDAARGQAKASIFGVKSFSDFPTFLQSIEAVSVATPTTTHAEVGIKLLSSGINSLIEKPLATTPAECQALIDASTAHNALLAVGHVERFNPAIIALRKHLTDTGAQIASLSATRINEASNRITDVPVTLDLMIHDLDISLALLGFEVTDIRTSGDNDERTAILTFAGRQTATLFASRKRADKRRTLEVATDKGTYALDYVAQTLSLNGTALPVIKGFSLENELRAFIQAILQHTPPEVSGQTALKVLEVMAKINP